MELIVLFKLFMNFRAILHTLDYFFTGLASMYPVSASFGKRKRDIN